MIYLQFGKIYRNTSISLIVLQVAKLTKICNNERFRINEQENFVSKVPKTAFKTVFS